jgi:flagellar hook-basal body complex protein FliE
MSDTVNLNSIQNLVTPKVTTGQTIATGAAQTADGSSFKDMLMKSLNEVNSMQQDADTTLENFVSGKTQNVGEVISASQKASMAFSMLVQIRNKLQDAYDEVRNLKV